MKNEPSYYRASGKAYMVFPCPKENEQRGYQYHMLAANHIEGLLSCSMREIDGEAFLYYDMTGCQSIRNLYQTRQISGQIYRRLLEDLSRLSETLGGYLLDVERVPLCADMVFFRYSEERFSFLYLPWGDAETDLFSFAAEHIDTTAKEETASAFRLCSAGEDLGEAVWDSLSEEWKKLRPQEAEEPRPKTMDSLREEIPPAAPEPSEDYTEEKEKNPAPARGRKRAIVLKWILAVLLVAAAAALLWGQSVLFLTDAIRNLCRAAAALSVAGAAFVTADQILSLRAAAGKNPYMDSSYMNRAVEKRVTEEYEIERRKKEFSETEATAFEEPPTTLLGADTPGRLYGSGKARGCTILLEDLPVTVGKSIEYADQVLGDPSVSRVHARFTKNRRGEIEICDLGSTNGTKVNGISVKMQEKMIIERGDEVQIGALTFFYR